MDVVKTDINKNFFDISDLYRQIWAHEQFALRLSSQPEISRERAEGKISDNEVKIVAFLKQAKFATADQISRATGIKLESLLTNDFKNSLLGQMFHNLMINYFVIGAYEQQEMLKEKDALKVFTLDFGGDYLLSYEGHDMTNWRPSEYFAGIAVVKKALQQTEVLLNLLDTTILKLRSYEQFKVYRSGNELVQTDFFASMETASNKIFNFIGYFVEPNFEDLRFRDNIDILNQVFKKSNAWERYFPMEDLFPRLLVFVQNSDDKKQIERTMKVIANASEFSGEKEVFIIGYNDIIKNGLKNSIIRSFSVVDDKNTIEKKTFKTKMFS